MDIYRKIPPIPEKVVTTEGQVLYTGQDVKDGQNVWQSIGGQTVGSIWDTALILLRTGRQIICTVKRYYFWMNWPKKDNKVYHNLPDEEQARYKILLQKELRTNTFDETSNTIVISPQRAKVQRESGLLRKLSLWGDPSMDKLRNAYAIPVNTVKDIGRMQK